MNWKTDECHEAYWRLLPTVDHVLPIARGGEDAEPNWVTASQLSNSAKSIGDLPLVPPGDGSWDGRTRWVVEAVRGFDLGGVSQTDRNYIRS